MNLKNIRGTRNRISGWSEYPFRCKLKRQSLLGMVANGDIDSSLLNAVHILFHRSSSPKDVVSMK